MITKGMDISIEYISEDKVPRWGHSQYDELFEQVATLGPGEYILVKGVSGSQRIALYTHLSNQGLKHKYSIVSTGDLATIARRSGARVAEIFGDIAIMKRPRGKKKYYAETYRVRQELRGQEIHGRDSKEGTSNA